MGELSRLTQQAIADRALGMDLAVSKDCRDPSHVDTSDARLMAVEALLDVRKRKPYWTCSAWRSADGVISATARCHN